MNEPFPQFLFILIGLPSFLVNVAGFVLALMWWRRMPMVALWAALGFGCMIACHLAAYAAFPVMQFLARILGLGNPSSGHTYALIASAVSNLLSTAGLAMLTVAVFGWRQPRGPQK